MVSDSSTDLLGRLDHLDALDRELAAIRDAPAPLEERLAALRADLQDAAAAFQRQPWSPVLPLRTVLAAVNPKAVLAFEQDRLRQAAAEDPREPIDVATRRERIAAGEAEITGLLDQLGHDDLVTLERARDSAHAVLRGLAGRRDEVIGRCDRRSNVIELLRHEREAGQPATRPQPFAWPAYDLAGEPNLAPSRPPQLTQAEESARNTAIGDQIAVETAELERDRATLAAIEAEHREAAARWRKAAENAERCGRWLRRKQIAPADMPAAAE